MMMKLLLSSSSSSHLQTPSKSQPLHKASLALAQPSRASPALTTFARLPIHLARLSSPSALLHKPCGLPLPLRQPFLLLPIYPYFVEFLYCFISCLPSCLVPTSTTWKTSFLHHHLAPIFSYPNTHTGARITCELLNGKNFAAWSHSVRLFLGGKGKFGWLLGTITKPNATDPKFVQWEIDNCTILGWLFNSMEPRIYHVFMYMTWSLFFMVLFDQDSRWEELAQYEPLSEFTTEGGIAARRLDRQHTYQFLMGLKPEFEALRTQIVNTTPMPSIFEAFAMLDGDERRHRLLQLPPPPVTESTIPDQMALAASGSRFSSGRSSSGRAPCSFCGGVTHGRDRCFKLHPELRETFKPNKEKSKASPRTAAISETSYWSLAAPTAPDHHQLQTQFQNQMEQLQLQFQTQLGSLMQQSPRPNPSPSTATLASVIPTALHFVRIADGSAVHIRSKGEICLSSQLTLSFVLYVPDFAYKSSIGYSFLSKGYRCYDPLTSHMFTTSFGEKVRSEIITPHFVPSSKQAADMFTKIHWSIIVENFS
ncbi:hypothetical protein Acr_01g0001440 [Actinidia rufa]|uniref:Retrotransposon Copia-like N-terminal domain-containing protein n=1 Tax=Actinidia rufa TaxID=165716 RepID=A0A7J0E1F0_9ERIC|nr:hypothetical protein Acr_01g0001440 [Actinidia rufa]